MKLAKINTFIPTCPVFTFSTMIYAATEESITWRAINAVYTRIFYVFLCGRACSARVINSRLAQDWTSNSCPLSSKQVASGDNYRLRTSSVSVEGSHSSRSSIGEHPSCFPVKLSCFFFWLMRARPENLRPRYTPMYFPKYPSSETAVRKV